MQLRRDPRRGIVLALVLVLVLVLATAVVTLQRRSVVDVYIAKNRDRVAQSEALARGGVQLALGLILEDLLSEQAGGGGVPGGASPLQQESGPIQGALPSDLWARADQVVLPLDDGSELRLEIRDAGARINLNALIDRSDELASSNEEAVLYLADLLEKVIPETDLLPAERALLDRRELAENLIDYLDADDLRQRGGAEDDYYLRLRPPQEAADRPLLSPEELLMVEGFTPPLVEALQPYVTVYPLASAPGQGGVNLNTAPPHVLAGVWHGQDGDRRLLSEDVIRRILQARDQGKVLCDDGAADPNLCVTPLSVGIEGTPFPTAALPTPARVFEVRSRVRVATIERSVQAVLDLANPQEPRLLSYRVE